MKIHIRSPAFYVIKVIQLTLWPNVGYGKCLVSILNEQISCSYENTNIDVFFDCLIKGKLQDDSLCDLYHNMRRNHFVFIPEAKIMLKTMIGGFFASFRVEHGGSLRYIHACTAKEQ